MPQKLLAIAAAILLLTVQAHAVAKDPFDGKWEVTVSPDEDSRKSGEKEFKETFEFKGSKFSTEEMKKKGFDSVAYEADVRKIGPAQFTAKPKSEKEGEAEWKGVVVATEIEGTLVWTKKDGTKVNFTFKGSRKDK